MSLQRQQRANTAWVLRIAAAEWRGWSVLIAATLLTSLISLLNPWPLKLLLDYVLSKHGLPDSATVVTARLPRAETALGFAAYVAIAGVVLFVLETSLDVLLQRRWIRTGQQLVYELSARLFEHAQRLSIVRYSRMQVGDLISRITGDSWCIYNLASALLFTPAHALVMTIAMLLVLWRMNAQLAVVAACAAPLMAIVAFAAGQMSRRLHRAERDVDAQIQSHVQQSLAGIPVVQSFAQEDRHLQELMRLAGSAVRAQRRAALIGGIGNLAGGGVAAFGSALVMVIGARLVLHGRMTVGDVTVFLAYLGMLHGELSNLLSTYGSVRSAQASVDRVAEFMNEPIEQDVPDAVAMS
jgi:ATP-binding cassette subfamily B protein/subfamily B ATP-binding cassette protein MsbA